MGMEFAGSCNEEDEEFWRGVLVVERLLCLFADKWTSGDDSRVDGGDL
jgi:hypothetical protein